MTAPASSPTPNPTKEIGEEQPYGRTLECRERAHPLWLEERHGYLVCESVPVPVVINGGGNSSDIDLVALAPPAAGVLSLLRGARLGPRVIVETKDEPNWEATGKAFGVDLLHDVALLGTWPSIPHGTPGVKKFTMLGQEHHDVAASLCGTDDFNRLFVVHALDLQVRAQVGPMFAERRIYWLTIPELVADLVAWVHDHPKPVSQRHGLMGDLLTFLVGFCQLGVPVPQS